MFLLFLLFSQLLKKGITTYLGGDDNINKFLYWVHLALIEGRYSGQADSILETDIQTVKKRLKRMIYDKLREKLGQQDEISERQFKDGQRSKLFNSQAFTLSRKERLT